MRITCSILSKTHKEEKMTVMNQEALQRRWQERCRQGNFSSAVLGVGTIRVMGRSGDTPVAFPRVESLAALDTLEADERWALQQAQDLINSARTRRRPVMATQPPRPGVIPNPVPVYEFDPKSENLLILSMTQGG
jgi:hypothetical protein